MIKYFKTLWENNITPVNGRNLNKIEDALEYLYDVIRNVPSEENIRIANEKQRQQDETTRSNSEIKRNATFDSKIKDVDKAINASNENIVEVNNKFESITASKQQDAEVIIARDGEESLNNRLKRDLYVDNIPLKQKVLDIEGLKEIQDLEYETDNGYKVCQNTKNGVVKDLKLYGKSLVNLLNYSSLTTIGSASGTFTKSGNFIKSTLSSSGSKVAVLKSNMDINNKIVTVIIDNKSTSQFCNFGKKAGYETIKNLQKGINVFTINTNNLQEGLYIGNSGTLNQGDVIEFSIMIIEGDVSQNPPQYLEGITSVGNGNEIEVLSVNSNILDKDKLLSISTNVFPTIKNNGFEVDYSSVISIPYYEVICTKEMFLSLNVVKKGSGDIIVRGYKNVDDLKASSNFTFNKGISLTGNISGIQIPIGTNFVAFHRGNANTGLVEIDDIMVTFDSSTVKYISHKQDKKPILFKDSDGNWKPVTELRGIYLNNCDTIEKHSDGKYYLKVRNEKVTINETSNVTQIIDSKEKTVRFRIVNNGSDLKRLSACLSDKFKSLTEQTVSSLDEEGIYTHSTNNTFDIRIDKSKADTIEKFKTWLQANPVTVIYQLEQEKVYEVSPLDLEAFENETMWMIESGPVSSHAEFKVTSSIQNFAKNTAERVDRLEDEVYKMNLANFAVSLNALELKSRLEALEAPQK